MPRFGRTKSWRKSRSRVARTAPLPAHAETTFLARAPPSVVTSTTPVVAPLSAHIRETNDPTAIRLGPCYESLHTVLLIWRNTVSIQCSGERTNMQRRAKPKVDNAILEMAIVGYQSQFEKISAAIAAIKAQLGLRGPGRPKATAAEPGTDHAGPAKRRTMSKSARAKIAAAQRARWAAQKRQQAQPAQPAQPKKRKMSAAGRRAIRAATKKRWAAWRKAQKAAA